MKLRHLLMLGMFMTPAAAAADSWRGKVVDVLDGDTLVVLQGGRRVEVCLHGVDAPEKDQPFGAKAKSFASQLVIGKLVTIKDTGKQRGCQIVAQVYLGSMHLNEELLKAGLAWHLRGIHKTTAFKDREGGARQGKRGLWRDSDPVAPWAWRLKKTPALDLKDTHPRLKNLTAQLTRETLPWSKDRRCKKSQDCTFVRKAPCACPPCSSAEGQVVNRTAFKRLHFYWARRTCSAKECAKCTTQPEVICLKGQCALHTSPPRRKHLACKTNKDCVFRFRTPCECPPCGKTWRQASNLKAFNAIKTTWSIKVPHCQTCKRCERPTQWLGSKALCIKGQCTVR